LSLLAFAGNSLLCRLALKDTAIDPTSFIAIRLASGAAVLWLVLALQQRVRQMEGSWMGAVALFRREPGRCCCLRRSRSV
jgi:glycerol uptake facilitator-like aquaporin